MKRSTISNLTIRRPLPDERERVIEYVAARNERPACRCLQLDTTVEGIGGEIDELDVPIEDLFFLAFEGTCLVGAVGVDLDREAACAWVWGPFCDDDTIMRVLLDHVHTTLPAWAVTARNYLDEENVRGIEAHRRLGYRVSGKNAQYVAGADEARWEEGPFAVSVAPEHADDVALLHDETFPGTWCTSAEVLKESERASVFVALEENNVAGYIHIRGHPTLSEATVEYLAVRREYRGKGLGRELLRTGLRWIFDDYGAQEAHLVVEEGKVNARRLYESVGFRLVTTGVALNLHRSRKKMQ